VCIYFVWAYGFMMDGDGEKDIIKQHLGKPEGDEEVGQLRSIAEGAGRVGVLKKGGEAFAREYDG
jgi:hypothetical protein